MVVYELSCPACKNVSRSPFVRVGAVVDCPGCRKRFVVDRDMIRRHVNGNTGEALQRLFNEFACPGPPMPNLYKPTSANGHGDEPTDPAPEGRAMAEATMDPPLEAPAPTAAPFDLATSIPVPPTAMRRLRQRRLQARLVRRRIITTVTMIIVIGVIVAVMAYLIQSGGADTNAAHGVQSAVSKE